VTVVEGLPQTWLAKINFLYFSIMKRIYILILLILCSAKSFAQKEPTPKNYRNKLFFAPANLLDVINPSFQVGYERKLSDKWGAQIEGGIIMRRSLFGFLFGDLTNYGFRYTNKGYKARAEVIYYLQGESAKSYNMYFSAEVFYTQNTSRVNDSFEVSDTTFVYPFPRDPGYYLYDDFFTQVKKRYGFNLKIGADIKLGRGYFFEPYLGLGIAVRNSEHIGRANPNDPLWDESFSWHNKAGRSVMFNLPWNIKFGKYF
jgi:hypothetical protein